MRHESVLSSGHFQVLHCSDAACVPRQVFWRPLSLSQDAFRWTSSWLTPEAVRTVFTLTSGFLTVAQVNMERGLQILIHIRPELHLALILSVFQCPLICRSWSGSTEEASWPEAQWELTSWTTICMTGRRLPTEGMLLWWRWDTVWGLWACWALETPAYPVGAVAGLYRA